MNSSDNRRSKDLPEIQFGVTRCRLGKVLAAQSDKGVCAILLGDADEELLQGLQNFVSDANLIREGNGFKPLLEQIAHLIDCPWTTPRLRLDLRGTFFQKKVWRALQEVPAGAKITYSELAGRIGGANLARAVGQACAANRVAVAVPCHRALSKNGKLTGYRWGLGRKKLLLEMEAQFSAYSVEGDKFYE